MIISAVCAAIFPFTKINFFVCSNALTATSRLIKLCLCSSFAYLVFVFIVVKIQTNMCICTQYATLRITARFFFSVEYSWASFPRIIICFARTLYGNVRALEFLQYRNKTVSAKCLREFEERIIVIKKVAVFSKISMTQIMQKLRRAIWNRFCKNSLIFKIYSVQ